MHSGIKDYLSSRIKVYSVITEADEPDKEVESDTPDASAEQAPDINNLPDPTKTGDTEGDIPAGADGAFVSDTKLANFASILIKAYQTAPKHVIPDKYLNVTRQNANEVIKYVESQLELNEPTDQMVDNLQAL